jgi:tRNA (guanine37-N1)-methyltransferase
MKKQKNKPQNNRKRTRNIRFDILSLFPEAFTSYFQTSIIKRAQNKKLLIIKLHHIRDFATGKHKTTDEKPYGGGPGMVMKFEPIYGAIKHALANQPQKQRTATRIIVLSAKGKQFTQQDAHRLSKYKRLIIICGHYEGIDERVAKFCADEEICVGPYVLTGGEIPAMILVDAISRYVPGVLGKSESLEQESFTAEKYKEYPHFTRPEKLLVRPLKKSLFDKQRVALVPKVLLSGDHKKINDWRKKHSKQ